jgi:hypothetical protein
MTAMPQMVALFNGVGGGAAALIAFSEYHIATSSSLSLANDAVTVDAVLGDRGIGQLRRVDGRVRQAAGADHRQPGHDARPEAGERRAVPGGAGPGRLAVRGQPERGRAGAGDGARRCCWA